MAKLPFPDVPPGPLRELLEELHKLHARAGWPSTREIAKDQRFSHTAVHELFTKADRVPTLPVLLAVVDKLATSAPGADSERELDRFDSLWAAINEPELSGKIDYPRSGQRVPSAFTARGTITGIPSNKHIWLAVRINNLIWPKEPEIPSSDRKWSVQVVEAGTTKNFSLVLLMIGPAGNQEIDRWLSAGHQGEGFPGLTGVSDSSTLDIVDELIRQ